jgi:hypothetical protein
MRASAEDCENAGLIGAASLLRGIADEAETLAATSRGAVSDAVALVFLANLHDDELDDAAQRQLEAFTAKYVPDHPTRGQ